jgi:hypothetical protein
MIPQAFPKIDIQFSPAWWVANYGMDFGSSQVWQNPILATEREREQRRLLYERFGEFGLGEADPQPNPTVGGEFGHRFMSEFWGCEVVYLPGQWPHTAYFPDARQLMETLKVPDVRESTAVKLLFKNARILEEHYGKVRSMVNFGGPLNNAVSVLGEAIFEVIGQETGLAGEVLHKMGEAVLVVLDEVECKVNRIPVTGRRKIDWGIGNCPVGQISPTMYQKIVLPADLWIRKQFTGKYNLHHCGLFDSYTQVYQALCPTSLDVGPGTNLHRTRTAYPQTPISTYIEVGSLAQMSINQVDGLISRMIEDAAPVELFTCITVAEIGPEISDDTIRALLTVQNRLSSR